MAIKLSVLFLCAGNSCRSQMAEGWTQYLKGHAIDVYSAGIEKHGLNPFAVQVMKEAGVEISHQQSKTVSELERNEFDFVITVCSDVNENCHFIPASTKVIHYGFDDPPRLAAAARNEEEKLFHYRRVRDEIREFVKTLPDALQ